MVRQRLLGNRPLRRRRSGYLAGAATAAGSHDKGTVRVKDGEAVKAEVKVLRGLLSVDSDMVTVLIDELDNN